MRLEGRSRAARRAESASGWQTLALRWMAMAEWRAHPVRWLTAALAIAIGVALGYAVHLVNRSALDEFARAVQTVNGAADLQVQAIEARGFDENLYPVLARIPGVAQVSPVVERTLLLPDRSRLTVLGLDVLRAARVTPTLVGRPFPRGAAGGAPVDGAGVVSDLFAQDAVYLSSAAVRALAATPGQRVQLDPASPGAHGMYRGSLPGVPDSRMLAVMDIAAAQWKLGTWGRLQRLDIALDPAADAAAVQAAIRAALPPDAQLVTPQSEAQRSDSLSRAYRVNLEMLAMVALLTGGFLVYSAQSLSVVRRRAPFALLRVLGLRRGALLGQLLLEGAVLGVLGSLLGLALGAAMAALALQFLGGDLGGGYFAGSTPAFSASGGAALVFLLLGVLVAMVGSLWPALQALRVQAAVALKSGVDGGDPRHAPRLRAAGVLLPLGVLAALAPPLAGLPVMGYASIAIILAGGIAATPWLARTLLAPWQARVEARATQCAPLYLALKRLWGAPAQAAVALSGVVASTSLMVAMALMVASFRGSVDEWMHAILPADVYMRIDGGETGGLDAVAQSRLAATPGLARIAFRRTVLLRLHPERAPVALLASPIDAANPQRSLPLVGGAQAVPTGQRAVWVSEPFALLYGAQPGQTLVLPLGGQSHTLFVAGIWRDYSRQFGALAMDEGDYQALSGDTGRAEAAIDLQPGASVQASMEALRQALPAELAGRAEFARPAEIRAVALKIFDRSFAATYALEAIAILVGMAGVAATFSAQTLARTREFGMLRHIGVLRRQVLAMLALEGALLGGVGGVAGLALGAAMGQVLIHVVNPQSFHWTMDTRWPVGLFAALWLGLVVASALTAVLAGRSALSADAVRAVREDW
jgi:putative ABC transport system permease protein